MLKRRFTHPLVAVLVLISLLLQGTLVLAGTTGGLSGTVLDSSSKPVAQARVTATSPSQSVSTSTDGGGHFTFASLSPDTYTVSVEKQGYDSVSQSGVNVFADQTQTLSLLARPTLREIGRTTARAQSDIVRPGTTADVYSVNAAVAEKAAALGGGGALNQAYSAIASVPGTYVAPGSSGWNQAVIVRGSNYDQTGYEYDGVPVNRAFDNYAAHTAPSIGQQELQVYTGGGPASSSATGLGGFINQVIRTGTSPGFADGKFALGDPTYYHNLNLEFGGATPDRNFSYYVGYTGFNQDFRYGDQFNGSFGNRYETPLVTPGFIGPNGADGAAPLCSVNPTYAGGCYAFAPGSLESAANISDREFVTNLHVGLPHKRDGGKDDIQLLYTSSALDTSWGDSPNEIAPIYNQSGASAAVLGAGSTFVPSYKDAVTFPTGTTFGQSAAGLAAVPYLYPSSPLDRASKAPIAGNRRDGFANDASIIKLQYQKNFSSSAYLRVYGYSLYSDWLNNGAVSRSGPLGFLPVNVSPDYELDTHTHGFEAQLADQVDARNLLQLTFNFSKATSVRFNNATMSNTLKTAATNLVDANGFCYTKTGDRGLCNSAATSGTYGNPTPFAVTGVAAANGASFIVSKPGVAGSFNTVSPTFSDISLTDVFKPTDKLSINLGIRDENYQYDLNPTNDPGNQFFALTAQREFCYNPSTLAAGKSALTCATGLVHPDGKNGSILYSNNYPLRYTQNVLEPRVAFTYTVTPDAVVRGSYGRYAEPPNTAAVQYQRIEPNTPAFFFPKFAAVGFFEPLHNVRPAVANNYDVSLEKHFRGTDVSFKVTPFYKNVKDNLQDVYIDQVTQFVSSINAGTVTSKGLEFQFNKGDFNRDGLAFQLSYTYTDSKIKYQNLGNSAVNPIDQINASIKGYNGFTKGGGGSPCYTTTGAGIACAADPTAVINPYYNSPVQGLLDRNGSYTPFTFTPAIQGAAQTSFYVPHVVAFVSNYKKGPLSISPSLQLFAGQQYGAPLNHLGYDPSTCTANQTASGIASAIAAGIGQRADWTSCAGSLNIPNPDGKSFDGMGAYTQPSQLIGNISLAYQMSKNVTANVLFSNLLNTCFGGSNVPWATGGRNACGYGLDGYTATTGVGPNYNGTSPDDAAANGGGATPAYNRHAYTLQSVTQPVNIYFQLNFKV